MRRNLHLVLMALLGTLVATAAVLVTAPDLVARPASAPPALPSPAPAAPPPAPPIPPPAPSTRPPATSTAPSTSEPVTTAVPVQPAPPLTTSPSVSPARPENALATGEEGTAVLALQHRLQELGYWLGTPDGSYGGLTGQAVTALQKVEGLTPDGVVGDTTAHALDIAGRPEARSDTGDLVEVDKARQVLLIVRDGRVAWVLNTSTGTEEPYQVGGTTELADTPPVAGASNVSSTVCARRPSARSTGPATSTPTASPCTAPHRCRPTRRRTAACG